ncbi:hypothetical protein K7432_012309 [Basidiobolus ranarum]|uniref:C2H2-type domain-containing protein n=1 Tax=Basidiobolus ranarum TaxID=34480 RepID=A0ABR2WKX9_9FUNG
MKISSRTNNYRRKPVTINCSLCEKTFNRKDNYLRHYRSHTGDLPHMCPHSSCKKGFTRSDQLVRHIASKHNDTHYRNESPDSSSSAYSDDSLQTVRMYDHLPTLSSKFISFSPQQCHCPESTRMSLQFLLN